MPQKTQVLAMVNESTFIGHRTYVHFLGLLGAKRQAVTNLSNQNVRIVSTNLRPSLFNQT